MYKRKATLRQPWRASRVIGRAGGRDKQNCSAFLYKTTSLALGGFSRANETPMSIVKLARFCQFAISTDGGIGTSKMGQR